MYDQAATQAYAIMYDQAATQAYATMYDQAATQAYFNSGYGVMQKLRSAQFLHYTIT
ncbi:hypothetical protein [Dictyobacter kobayashii]|uniref:Uncharacterized protein n=1 Tax=Dictyobacter kobayashii TaxID=2014872 RepID=A0A402AEA5_9CHLR|nr:hypothetical protein [Dictyobacter kobayashii]GCE17457.1 hypothetical protein KDK_12570 [Dictyobacter kobayashii]